MDCCPPVWVFCWRRKIVLWCLRRLAIYHCNNCGVLTPYVGNNDERGRVWCERCANDGIVATDYRRAKKQEEEWARFVVADLPEEQEMKEGGK